MGGPARSQDQRVPDCETETVDKQAEHRRLGGAVSLGGIRGTLPTLQKDPLLEGPRTELLSFLCLENRSSCNHSNEIITID